jgi:hypothetical protein
MGRMIGDLSAGANVHLRSQSKPEERADQLPLTPLVGSGPGQWGDDTTRAVGSLGDEWDRDQASAIIRKDVGLA